MTLSVLYFLQYPITFGAFVFLALCSRYLVISGGAYFLFWKIFSSRLNHRRIQVKDRPTYVKSEVIWSLLSFVMMACFSVFLLKLYSMGILQVKMSMGNDTLRYHLITLLILFLIHDAYFYWMHRALHHPILFKSVHKVHHMSINPSPWAAFSFHPLEAVAEMFFLLPVLCIMPVHLLTLSIFLFLSHVFNMMGHLGFELCPPQTWHAWWGSWLTTTTHHNLHHQYFQGNYALYFRFWDKFGKTLLSKTETEFLTVTSKPLFFSSEEP